MKKNWEGIILYFKTIDYNVLKSSVLEVLWLTLIALLPLFINIIIAWIVKDDFIEAIKTKILPGEILSYCLSFLAPSLHLLLIKTQGSGYKLPILHFFSIVTFGVYGFSMALYIIAKNKFNSQINLEPHGIDVYFKTALIFLVAALFSRIYAIYHGKNLSSFSMIREQQQKDFNKGFANSLNKQ